MPAATETSILERLIDAPCRNLPQEAAHYLLSIDFQDSDRARMNELAAKAGDGSLDMEEAVEVQHYRQVSHILALIHSKARKSLGQG